MASFFKGLLEGRTLKNQSTDQSISGRVESAFEVVLRFWWFRGRCGTSWSHLVGFGMFFDVLGDVGGVLVGFGSV